MSDAPPSPVDHLREWAGAAPADPSRSGGGPDYTRRLARALNCLGVLDRVWPAPDGEVPRRVGRFEIVRRLGYGGCGIVYAARDPVLRRVVALKVPHLHHFVEPELRRRFLREARVAARLSHPNLVRLHEAGEAEPLCYLASEYCDGPDLATWLKQQAGPVPARTAAGVVAALADAAHYLHGQGVLHRDIKPANVLLDPLPSDAGGEPLPFTPKLTDFGLAKAAGVEGDETRSGAILGTPLYMAPEQAAGRREAVGPAADVYSLGAILYELLTGRPPHRGHTDLDTLRRMMAGDPVPPHRLRPDLPADLEAVCLRCLEQEPGRRYASAADLAADLRRFISGGPVSARPAGALRRGAKWARRRPAVAGLLALSLVLAVVLVAGGAQSVLALREERNFALAQQQTAERERDHAKRENRLARHHLLAAHLALAQREWRNGNSELALALLDRHRPGPGEEDLRGFEWYHLWGLCHRHLVLRGHAAEVTGAAFAGADRLASAGNDGTVRVWDARTGREVVTLRGHEGRVLCLAASPDGRLLATGGEDGTLRLWDAEAFAERAVPWRADKPVAAVAFAPDGRSLAAAATYGPVRVWDVAGLRERASLDPYDVPAPRGGGFVACLAFTPDGGSLVVAMQFNRLKVWDIAANRSRSAVLNHAGATTGLAVSPDGRVIVTGSDDHTAKLWDLGTLTETASLPGHADSVAVAFSPDGRLLATADRDGVVRVWDPAGGRERATLRGHTGPVTCLAFSPGGKALATGGRDRTVRLWDAEAGQPLPGPATPRVRGPAPPSADRVEWRWGHGPLFGLALAPDGRTLVAAGRTRMWIGAHRVAVAWDLGTGRELGTFDVDRGSIGSVAYTRDGRWAVLGQATGSPPGMITFWNPGSGARRDAATGTGGHVWGIAPLPDGRTIATASGTNGVAGEMRLWDAETGRPVAVQRTDGDYVRAVAASPFGDTVAAGHGDGWLEVWDARLTARRYRVRAHDQRIFALAFSPDGKTLLSAGRDGTARLWDAATGDVIDTLEGHNQSVTAAAFAPDGRSLATGSGDGTVKFWDPLTGEERLTLRAGGGIVWSLVFSADGRTLAAGSEDGVITLWSAAPPDPAE